MSFGNRGSYKGKYPSQMSRRERKDYEHETFPGSHPSKTHTGIFDDRFKQNPYGNVAKSIDEAFGVQGAGEAWARGTGRGDPAQGDTWNDRRIPGGTQPRRTEPARKGNKSVPMQAYPGEQGSV